MSEMDRRKLLKTGFCLSVSARPWEIPEETEHILVETAREVRQISPKLKKAMGQASFNPEPLIAALLISRAISGGK